MTETTTDPLVAAFFDLDKTIIAGSSLLAYRKILFEDGLITRRTLARAAYSQVLFKMIGASENKMKQAETMMLEVTRGWNGAHVSKLIGEALDEIIIPIIYKEAADLIKKHQDEGREVIIVSSAPIEIVQPLADHFKVNHCIATTVRRDLDGNFNGELELLAYGAQKPKAIRELAEKLNIDLAESYAYSDSFTDVPLLECVGHPVVVNPDRQLARYAHEQNWPITRFTQVVRLDNRKPLTFAQEHWRELTGVAVAVGAVAGSVIVAGKHMRSSGR